MIISGEKEEDEYVTPLRLQALAIDWTQSGIGWPNTISISFLLTVHWMNLDSIKAPPQIILTPRKLHSIAEGLLSFVRPLISSVIHLPPPFFAVAELKSAYLRPPSSHIRWVFLNLYFTELRLLGAYLIPIPEICLFRPKSNPPHPH